MVEKNEIAELDRLVKVVNYVPVDTSQWHHRSYQLGKAIIPFGYVGIISVR